MQKSGTPFLPISPYIDVPDNLQQSVSAEFLGPFFVVHLRRQAEHCTQASWFSACGRPHYKPEYVYSSRHS